MKKPVASIKSPGQLTLLAALLATIALPVGAATAEAPRATHLVISQVYGGGGNGSATLTNDYIELFNPTGAGIPLNGLSVQYAAAAATQNFGASGTVAPTLLPNITLAPGHYFLVQESTNNATVGGAMPTPDAVGVITMSVGAGKVALVTGTTALPAGTLPTDPRVIDWVAYGPAATPFEGTGSTTTTLTSTKAAFRTSECADQNDNAAEFTAATPAPRNTASATKSCGASANAIVLKTSCPASLSFVAGTGGSLTLKASDADSAITGAQITSGARAGVALSFVGAAAAAEVSATLSADASVPAGSYPVDVTFTNGNSAESATCTVTLSAGGKATIAQIQGTGATSPLNNTVQTTEGVITKIISNGFFIQDTVNGGPAGASLGLFIFGATPAAAVGDLVRVTGTVTEFFPVATGRSYTEMKNVTDPLVILSSGNTVTPTNLSLPMANLANYDSMLVQLSNNMVINSTNSLTTYGELALGTTRHEVPTNRFPKGAEADALAAANAADTFILNSVSGAKPTVSTIPYFDYNVGTRRVGDEVSNLLAVLDYGSIGGGKAAFKLQPVLEPSVSSSNVRPVSVDLPVGNLRVASANVLNYFTTFTNGQDMTGNTGKVCTIGGSPASAGECRGANTKAEFDRQSTKIVNELAALNADIVGLMEIQNNLDDALADVSVSYLVDQLNAKVGFGTYTYVGGAVKRGTDAIRVAMIYKPAVVSTVGGPIADADLDKVNNRGPLAQTFKAANGAKFSVVVNHLKSKSTSGCPASGTDADNNDSQGCFNATRVKQAQHLAGSFVPYVINTSGDSDVLLIGDFNSHGFEDPINVLTASGLVNELERFVRPNGMVYSYVFGAESGYLDHALATPGLNPQVLGATEWHNNADEPTFIDYNSGAFSTLYKDNAYRASDHDPVVVSLNLAPTFTNVTSQGTVTLTGAILNRATGKYTGKFAFTNKGATPISGPFMFELSGLTSGVMLDSASSHNGVPYVSLSNSSIAPNETISTTLTFSNPSKGLISFTPVVYAGSF